MEKGRLTICTKGRGEKRSSGLRIPEKDSHTKVNALPGFYRPGNDMRIVRIGLIFRKADFYPRVFAEWVVRHPDDWFGDPNVGIAIRLALDEFIVRHKEEFLSID
jgi:hypothetical protein